MYLTLLLSSLLQQFVQKLIVLTFKKRVKKRTLSACLILGCSLTQDSGCFKLLVIFILVLFFHNIVLVVLPERITNFLLLLFIIIIIRFRRPAVVSRIQQAVEPTSSIFYIQNEAPLCTCTCFCINRDKNLTIYATFLLL